ncbi:hypothetical protein RM549_05235 [Salegentibacter sp. F188]|uniref:DUF2383 domain-containing protein n=1 Tax=Autumnicola patrickiae TaxID=3075591 RepID=A0ABU3DZQ0_9FLAO|nr:hypothetical protein [Salegentibacter sp. F188]MDT0689177.1 hypothetical protein [Salegentibacter sp. F188]
MKLKKKILLIEKLEELRSDNLVNCQFYQNAYLSCDKIYIKNIFLRLCKQKENFCEELETLIKELQQEVYALQNNNVPNFTSPKKIKNTSPGFRMHSKRNFYETFKRESKSYAKYLECLAKANDGKIREKLMSHRHKIHLTLSEMNIMGIKKYPIGSL